MATRNPRVQHDLDKSLTAVRSPAASYCLYRTMCLQYGGRILRREVDVLLLARGDVAVLYFLERGDA